MNGFYDVEAELVLAGCVVASARATRLAHDRLEPQHFSRPHLRRLFEIAPNLDSQPPDFDTDPTAQCLVDIRTTQAAELANVDLGDVRQLVEQRPLLDDRSGAYAGRVLLAWHRREIAIALEDAMNRLSLGTNDDAVASLCHAIGDAVSDPARTLDLAEVSENVRRLRMSPA